MIKNNMFSPNNVQFQCNMYIRMTKLKKKKIHFCNELKKCIDYQNIKQYITHNTYIYVINNTKNETILFKTERKQQKIIVNLFTQILMDKFINDYHTLIYF